jgi:hypothetical protein
LSRTDYGKLSIPFYKLDYYRYNFTVNWSFYFSAVARTDFQPPVLVRLEYPGPGATPSVREENSLSAAERDLRFLKAGLREAYP